MLTDIMLARIGECAKSYCIMSIDYCFNKTDDVIKSGVFWMLLKKRCILIVAILMMATLVYANRIADATVFWMQSRGISPTLIVLIISMLPLIELRGSIPIAILLFKMSWQEAVILSLIGNMLPIPIILLFMEWFFNFISKIPIGAKFTNWLFKRTRRKGKVIEKYEALGLTIFVGIPLPGTGAWTGAFAAKIFGISFWKSILYITIGVIIAAVAVTLLSVMGNVVVTG